MSCHPAIVPRRPTVAPGRARRRDAMSGSAGRWPADPKRANQRLTPTKAVPVETHQSRKRRAMPAIRPHGW